MGSVPNETCDVNETSKAFRVAVIGGGICGLSLAIGLLKHEHIDVQIYEAAPAFGEIGMGLTVGPNAQRALELIGPETETAFTRTKTPNLWQSHANQYTENRVGKGEHEGSVIAQQKNQTGMLSVHRARFLEELVKPIPARRAHFGKRLVSIDVNEDNKPLVMHFKDGTTEETDAVIGSDGIHSAVRLCLLGEDQPAARAVFANSVSYRGVVSMDRAVEKVGAEYAQNSMMLCGPGNAIFNYPIEGGKFSNIVMMNYRTPEWTEKKWIVPAKIQHLRNLLEGWGPTAQGLCDLLDAPELSAWAMYDHPPAPFYNKGRVVMIGDAAHATTPFQGQGAAQAIEDALVLKTLLGKTNQISEIGNAFAAFDQVRRPRSQRVVTTSRESGNLLGMQLPGVGDDIKKMKEKFDTRMHWIWHRDLTAQNDAALKLFSESL